MLTLAHALRRLFLDAEQELRTARLFLETEDTDKTRLAVAMAELNLRLARQDYFDSALAPLLEEPAERQYGAALIRQSGIFGSRR